MEVHIAFSVMLPEYFLMHVSGGKRKKKKLMEELPWTGNKYFAMSEINDEKKIT